MSAEDVAQEAKDQGRKVERSEHLDWAVRAGLVCYGVVHLLVAFLAGRLALGDQSGNASADGALHQLARESWGRIALFVLAFGFAALVVWRVLEALFGHHDHDGSKRVFKRLGSALKVGIYGSLAFSAFTVAFGSGSRGDSGSGDSTNTLTSRLMSIPGGQLFVALVGVAVIGYAARLIWRGFSGDFLDKLTTEGQLGDTGRAFEGLGRVGYVSKGVAVGIIGGLFVWAAWTHDPKRAGGLDQALHQVLQERYGSPALLAIAIGIGCYGLFCFAWARHLDR